MAEVTANPFVSLVPDAVREAAVAITRPHDPRAHWTQLAAVLGTVEDRQLYRDWGHRSLRVYAEHELNLAPSDTTDLLRLYRLIQSAGRAFEEWSTISKGKARVVSRALRLGGDPAVWLQRAASSETEDALRILLQRQLGDDVFIPYTVHIPDSLEPLVREAMRRALPIAIDDELPNDPHAQDALVERRDTQFRCLEVLCASFLQGRTTDGEHER